MRETIEPLTESPIPVAQLRKAAALVHNDLDDKLVEDCLAGIEYLEARTESLLVRRQVVATYDDREAVKLRSPVASITSVTVDGEPVDYSIHSRGHSTWLCVPGRGTSSVTVTYQAGETSLSHLVRKSIKEYVCGALQQREPESTVSLTEVEHGLGRVINLLHRGPRIG